MKELTHKIFKDTFIVMLSNIINYGGMFILAVMITRMLGVNALGEFTLIFAVSSILSSINEFGFSTLLVRKINDDPNSVFLILKNVNIFKFIFGIAIITVTIVVTYLIPSIGAGSAFAVGMAIVIPKSIQASYESSLRAIMKQALTSVIKSINTFVQIVIAYILLLNSYGLISILLMIFILEVLTALAFKIQNRLAWLKILNSNYVHSPVNLRSIVPLIKESWMILANNFLTLSMPRVNLVMIAYIITEAAAGIFSASSRIVNAVGLLSGALFNTYYPAITKLRNKPVEQFRFTSKILSYSIIAGLLINAILYLFSDILIDLTFKIDDAKFILKILSFTVLPILISSVLKAFFYTYFKEYYLFILFIVWWCFNIIAGYLSLYYWGIFGFAYSVLLTESIFCLILYYGYHKEKVKLNKSVE